MSRTSSDHAEQQKRLQAVVGLDVEAGSIAATEVTRNGEVRLGSFGIVALGPGVIREGEVADADALGAALKELFAEHKLSERPDRDRQPAGRRADACACR